MSVRGVGQLFCGTRKPTTFAAADFEPGVRDRTDVRAAAGTANAVTWDMDRLLVAK
jgi:hypothetical protein